MHHSSASKTLLLIFIFSNKLKSKLEKLIFLELKFSSILFNLLLLGIVISLLSVLHFISIFAGVTPYFKDNFFIITLSNKLDFSEPNGEYPITLIEFFTKIPQLFLTI